MDRNTADRAVGELASAAGVDVAMVCTASPRTMWLWSDDAMRMDGWTDMGGGRWAPVPPDQRSEWLTPTRGYDDWRDILADVSADCSGSGGGGADDAPATPGPSTIEQKRDAVAWVDSWCGADGWAVRHAARMAAVGRSIRMGATALVTEDEMAAKAKSRGLVLSAATRKNLSTEAAAHSLTPEGYLEALLSSASSAKAASSIVRHVLVTRMQAMDAAEAAPKPATAPARAAAAPKPQAAPAPARPRTA